MNRLLWPALVLLTTLAGAAAEDALASRVIKRIAFGSCNRAEKPQPLWEPILASKPDLWIWLGDIVYARNDELPGLARKYQAQKLHPGYSALRERCQVLGIYDDHDYGLNDGGRENPHKAASQNLLLDFLDEPPDSPRRKQAGIFAAYTFGPPGKQVKVLLLDGRYHREKPGASADVLGEEQWQWLERQLAGSDAEVHVIGSGTQVLASEHPYEKWAQFPKARQRLLDLVATSGAKNVIFLSGDRHLAEVSRITDPRVPYPIYDLTASGMTHHAEDSRFRNFSQEPNRFRQGDVFLGLNFGLIEFAWDATPRTATLEIRDAHDAVRISATLDLR